MAFGDVRGTVFTGTAASITNPFDTTAGSASVSVGDLVFCVLCQQTNLTVTGVTDNLGHTYAATNAGTDGGTPTGRAFWVRVTTAGTLTTLSAATTASTNDVAFVGVAFEGPFTASPLDANPANATDGTSPYTCPSSGTLAQADEMVIGWVTAGSGAVNAWSATAPNVLRVQAVQSGNNMRAIIGSQVVSATTAVAPAFTTGDAGVNSVVGTNSFMKAAAAGNPWYAYAQQ